MTIHDPELSGWGEAAWVTTGSLTTVALLVFIVAGAILGWFG